MGVSEAAMISSCCGDIPTEVETRRQSKQQRAAVTRRLVPLAGSAPVPLDSANCERSRELLEDAFDNDMYPFRCKFFCGFP